MFKIKNLTNELANTYSRSYHLLERADREGVVNLLGGKPVASFIVDKGHTEGVEVHTITDTGVVFIGNLRKHLLITWLIARPAQLQRYGIKDEQLLKTAHTHQLQGLNK